MVLIDLSVDRWWSLMVFAHAFKFPLLKLNLGLGSIPNCYNVPPGAGASDWRAQSAGSRELDKTCLTFRQK